jgi:DNA-binding transcriptional LysR family regulator
MDQLVLHAELHDQPVDDVELQRAEMHLAVLLALLDRTTRRMMPTEAGRNLIERARAVLGDYEAATQGLSDAPVRGVLRITAPVQFGRRHIAPIVAAFLDHLAEVEVELVLADRNLDLFDDAIDVALRIGRLADSGLTARQVGEVRRLWVASPAYLKRRAPRVRRPISSGMT